MSVIKHNPTDASVDKFETDVVLLSVFGRGNWMAQELTSRGWRTELVDLSSAFSKVDSEDREGPFGLFAASDLTQTQTSRFLNEASTMLSKNGFTVWTADGPIELNGQMTEFLLRSRQIPESVQAYLRQLSVSEKESERLRRAVARDTFSKNWLAQLAHDLCAPFENESFSAVKTGTASPILSRFYLRGASHEDERQGLQTLEKTGVKISEMREITSFAFESKMLSTLSGTSLNGEKTEKKSRVFVWLLSELETRNLNSELAMAMFEHPLPPPPSQWLRFRVQLKSSIELQTLPQHFLVIDDLYLPWDRANFFILRRSNSDEVFDVWLRVPKEVMTDDKRLEKIETEVKRVLEMRLPETVCTVNESLLQHSRSEAAQLRLWPQFESEKAILEFQPAKNKNTFFCTPESRDSLDWLGLYRSQARTLARLDKIKSKWDADFARAERKRTAAENKNVAKEKHRD